MDDSSTRKQDIDGHESAVNDELITHHQAKNAGTRIVAALIAAAIVWSGLHACRNSVRLDSRAATNAARARQLPDMRIDINKAGVAELALLPGLGPGLAQRIVDDREARGPFQSVDDADRVPGIGKAIIERMKPYAVAEAPQ